MDTKGHYVIQVVATTLDEKQKNTTNFRKVEH